MVRLSAAFVHGLAATVALVASGVAAQPSAPPAAPPAAAAPGDVRVPDLQQQFAEIDAGGLGEQLSSVPNFIGDGCAPGAGTSRLPVGSLVAVAQNLSRSNAASPTLLFGTDGSFLYKFPDQLDSVAALQAAGQTGVPPGANGPLPSPNSPIQTSVFLQATGLKPGPGTLLEPEAVYQQAADAEFQRLFPGAANGTTVFDPAASGYVAAPDAAGVTGFTAYAFYDYVIDSTLLQPGANVGFVKLTENVSPLPRDRVYMNYSYFHNALIGDLRNDVNRFTPGVEKTFADGWTSIEVRTPFAATLASSQTIDPTDACGLTDAQGVEFGNMSVIFKSVLALGNTWALTGGMQVMLPTAADVEVLAGPDGPALVQVENESTRLMPFMGFIWAPNDTFFSQTLLQVDTAANGNPAFLATPGAEGLGYVGQLEYPTFLYLSFATGYWAYRSDVTALSGFAPIAEIHVNQAFSGSDVIQGETYRLGADYGVVSLVNGLVGCNFEWGTRSTLTFAYATPLGGGVDRWFDGEFRAFWNYRFGPQNRLTRVQF
jgi:hypothetical protein